MKVRSRGNFFIHLVLILLLANLGPLLADEKIPPHSDTNHETTAAEFKSDQLELTLDDASKVQITSNAVSIEASNSDEELVALNELKAEIKKIDAPVETVVSASEGSAAIGHLKRQAEQVAPTATGKTKVVALSKTEFAQWWTAHHNSIYSLVRFTLNGTCIGASLYFTKGVPVPAAAFTAVVIGGMSGLIQYKLSLYNGWLKKRTFLKKAGSSADEESHRWQDIVGKTYNKLLVLGEEYGKWYTTEVAFLTVAKLALFATGVAHASLIHSVQSVVETAAYSTGSQGIGDLGVLKNMEVQDELNLHTPQYRQVVKNTSMFVLSAFSTTIAALQLVSQSGSSSHFWFAKLLGGSLKIMSVHIPVGFIAVLGIGVTFYVKAFVTERNAWKDYLRRLPKKFENCRTLLDMPAD